MSKTVLVTGANGFLGNGVAKAFSQAGWKTYGLIRRESAASDLWTHEVIPVIGSAADTSFVSSLPCIDVIVNTTEDLSNYAGHFRDNIKLFQLLQRKRNENGKSTSEKLLVLFTSGCKDYGMTGRHGDAGLAAQTEESPLNPPDLIRVRAEMSATIFNYKTDFDAILTRATTFYGMSGTYYAPLFDIARQAMTENGGDGILRLKANERSIMHGTHINDVASAYVALASAPRDRVVGEIFNISSRRYETAAEVAEAVSQSYGIKVEFMGSTELQKSGMDVVRFLMDFSQWVGSQKLRKITGWEDKMPLFTEDFDRYRKVYEAFALGEDERVRRMNALVETAKGSK